MLMKNDKAKKFKTAGVIALVVSGMVLIGIAYNNRSNTYKVEIKKENLKDAKHLEDAIKESDIALARLKKVIDSKDTEPAERYEAHRIYDNISQERANWVERLDKINAQKGKTIHLYDVDKSR